MVKAFVVWFDRRSHSVWAGTFLGNVINSVNSRVTAS